MKTIKHSCIFLIITFILGVTSCTSSNNDSTNDGVQLVNIIDSDKNIKYSFNDIYEIVDVIPLESEENILIGNAKKIFFVDELLVVFDKNTSLLRVFNRQGKFLYDIGKIGQAEGEYIHLDDVNFNEYNKSFSLFSNSDRGIFNYSLAGKFLGKTKINFWAYNITTINKDSILFNINFNSSDQNKSNNILLTNSKGEIINRYFPYEEHNIPSFSSTGFLVKNPKEILYSLPYDDTFYRYSNGKWVAKYKFDLNEYKIPSDKINDKQTFEKNIINYAYLAENSIENDELLSFSFLYKRILKNGIFLKKAKKTITGYHFTNESMFNILNPPQIVDSKILCSTIDDEIFFFHKSNNPSFIDSLAENNEKYKNIFLNHKESDNPILVFYKLKSELDL